MRLKLFLFLVLSPAYARAAQKTSKIHWEASKVEGGHAAIRKGTVEGSALVVAGKFGGNRLDAEKEAEILRALGDLGVSPRFHHLIHANGSSLIVMDWVDGDPLSKKGKRSEAVALQIAVRLLSHVGHLHRLGYVHEDLKPDNVMIGASEDPSSLKLIDFTQAWRYPSERFGPTGTPGFRAPEQLHTRARTPAVDTFAVAAILVYLLTGEVPFPMTEDDEALVLKTHDDRAVLEKIANKDLREILHKALAPNPSERFQTATDFREALERFVGRRAMKPN